MPLRVSILAQNFSPEQSGNAPYTGSLAGALASRGHEIDVHTTYPYYPDWSHPPAGSGWTQRRQENGVLVIRRKQYVPSSPTTLKRLMSELSFGLRLITGRWGQRDVLLLVSPSLFSSALALFRARLTPRRPAIALWIQDLYSQGVVEIGIGGRFTARCAQLFESWVLRHADGIAVIHDRFARRVIESLNVPAQDVTVIRNWSHLDVPQPVDRESVRAQRRWGADEVIVLHCGNQGAKQGLDQLRPVAERIDRDELPIRLVLMGDGNQRQSLESLLSEFACVDFVPPLPVQEFQAAMGAADLLLVCEREDLSEMSVPSKLTSYFSTGRPVIAMTDLHGVTAEEITRSGGGVCVQASDVDGFLTTVMKVASDERRSDELGAAGLRYRAEVLSEDAAVTSFERWLHDLAGSPA